MEGNEILSGASKQAQGVKETLLINTRVQAMACRWERNKSDCTSNSWCIFYVLVFESRRSWLCVNVFQVGLKLPMSRSFKVNFDLYQNNL